MRKQNTTLNKRKGCCDMMLLGVSCHPSPWKKPRTCSTTTTKGAASSSCSYEDGYYNLTELEIDYNDLSRHLCTLDDHAERHHHASGGGGGGGGVLNLFDILRCEVQREENNESMSTFSSGSSSHDECSYQNDEPPASSSNHHHHNTKGGRRGGGASEEADMSESAFHGRGTAGEASRRPHYGMDHDQSFHHDEVIEMNFVVIPDDF